MMDQKTSGPHLQTKVCFVITYHSFNQKQSYVKPFIDTLFFG